MTSWPLADRHEREGRATRVRQDPAPDTIALVHRHPIENLVGHESTIRGTPSTDMNASDAASVVDDGSSHHSAHVIESASLGLMIFFMCMRHTRITRGGQISVPAEVRRRWNTSHVTLDDRGDQLVVSPAPDDPISALRGSLKGRIEVGSEDLRKQARTDERAAGERRSGA